MGGLGKYRVYQTSSDSGSSPTGSDVSFVSLLSRPLSEGNSFLALSSDEDSAKKNRQECGGWVNFEH